jgi:uncharacterized protein YqeY
MTLENLQSAMIEAMRAGEKERKTAISNYIAQIKKSAIDKNCRDNIDEAFVDAELVKIQKSVQEQVDTCPATRADLLEKYNAELTIIKEFAPHLMTDPEEIRALIATNYSGAHTTKDIMKWLTSNYKGKIDMKIASIVVKEVAR